MDAPQSLKNLLQVHVASDAQAVLHLPYVLSTLNAEALQSSEHIQKWITRISSLVLSKDSGARWAGLCIALQTANLSRDLMVECAQTWVGATVPLLSKNEPVPTVKAAIRLMRRVFTGAMDIPEYQRQVCTPNVPKFSLALVALGEKTSDIELKVLVFETLTHLLPLYPSLHRASQNSLTNFATLYLNGAAPQALPRETVEAASRLHSVLHHTGGKVGAATQWRKSFDETLSFCWGALSSIRTTFPAVNSGIVLTLAQGDPIVGIPLNLDRLRIGVLVLHELLRSSNSRPVLLPIGQIVKLCTTLLRCTTTDIVEGHVDPLIRSLEVSMTPSIHRYGCNLVDSLVNCAGHLLVPHYSQLLFYVTHHLEQPSSPASRLHFLHSSFVLVVRCGLLHDSTLPSRLARAVLPSVTTILAHKSDIQNETEGVSGSTKSRKGKKRARGYEGDEVFKITRPLICTSEEEGEVILAALKVLQSLLKTGPLTSQVHSLTARVMLSLHLTLPHVPPSLLSPDASLHEKVQRAVMSICVELGTGTTNIMSKSLGLVVGTSLQNASSQVIFPELDLLLHPRVPPLVRSLPHVEALSLFRAEESQEELETRQALQLGVQDDLQDTSQAAAEPAPVHAVPSSIQPLWTVSKESLRRVMQPPILQTTAPLQDSSAVEPVVAVAPPHSSLSAQTPASQLPIQPSARTVNPPSNARVDVPDIRMIPDDLQDEDEPMPTIDADSDSEQEDS